MFVYVYAPGFSCYLPCIYYNNRWNELEAIQPDDFLPLREWFEKENPASLSFLDRFANLPFVTEIKLPVWIQDLKIYCSFLAQNEMSEKQLLFAM